MNLLRVLATVSSLTLVSRILGYLRDFIIARAFGAGLATDAFFVAFRIPNLLRRLFAEGAFSQAFVPVLSEYRTRRGDSETKLLVDRTATLLTLVLLAATALGVAAADHLSLHLVHLARFARRRNPQHLEPLRDTGADTGAAQSLLYFRGALFRALFRPAGHGARLGGVCRRRSAARVPDPPARKNRHAAAAATVPFGPWRAPDSRSDGTGGFRCLGRPDQPADQHHIRIVSRERQRLLALLCRSADGIPDGIARGGARNHTAPQPFEVSLQLRRRRVLETARLGPAPDRHPRSARRSGARIAFRAPRRDLVSLRTIRRARPLDDTPGAHRLQRGTARPDSRQDTGAGLLCAAKYQDAGPNRHRDPDRHPAHERRVDPSPEARRACALDRVGRLSERRSALPPTAPARDLSTPAGLGNVRAQGRGGS